MTKLIIMFIVLCVLAIILVLLWQFEVFGSFNLLLDNTLRIDVYSPIIKKS
ncbi:MAG: hypothetical protein FWE31_05055 [Firmicutes bacterium]|nr:hypothetical protein [Bacillota bacterium]